MVIGIIVAGVVFVILFHSRSELVFALDRLRTLRFGWMLLAGLAEFLSVVSYALLQRKLLNVTGFRIGLRFLLGITLATDAIADSLPGEPVFSSAFRFAQYRRHGVDAANATWVMVTVLVALALGLSALTLLGLLIALIFGSKRGPASLGALAVIVLTVMVTVLTRVSLWRRVLDWSLRISQHLPPRLRNRLHPALQQWNTLLDDIHVGVLDSFIIGLLGVSEWGLDLGCLILVFPALGFPIPWTSVILGYAASQIIGVVPITPGGLGIIEGSLSAVLITFGALARHAITAVLVYRLISYWLLIPIGWIAFTIIRIKTRRERNQSSETADR
ncbi:MAG: flippase-like domain-containing protein [Ferrimicrobium sp.]|jgi:uncharacterized protein (TIRG00374 family)|nr:flippase-like domain-containing protein [Ferrimicrobium sp.]